MSAPIVGHLDRYLGLGGHLPLDDTRLLDEGPQVARVGQHRSLQKEVGIATSSVRCHTRPGM